MKRWNSQRWHEWDGPPSDWDPEMLARRKQMGRRFGLFFLLFVLSAMLLFSGAVFLVLRSTSGGSAPYLVALVSFCATPLAIMMVLGLVGRSFFRRVGSPVADMMTAADAIAEGDLTVRVRESGSGDVGRLAKRFNLMTAELERAEQQRRNLTADVAHELRTPLHIIQGNLEGVADGVYEPSPEHIAATLEETRLLARLVDDLQTLSLAEAGQLPMHRRLVPAGDLLADAVTRFGARSEEQNVTLTLSETTDQALLVDVDPDRLDQVLSNLLGNALRHTYAGGTITLSSTATADHVRLTVSDTGHGISKEDLPYVFDRFWRGDRARHRTAGGGSGLGLAITRQLVLAHQGEIDVTSVEGEGTVFTVMLPRVTPKELADGG